MKITPHPDHTMPKPGPTGKRQATLTPPVPPPSDTTRFSKEARDKLLTAEGKNAASPAQRAREMLSDYENLGYRSFGGLVSAMARGEEVSVPGNGSVVPDNPEGSPVEASPPPEVTEVALEPAETAAIEEEKPAA